MAWFEPVLGTVLVTRFQPVGREAEFEDAVLAEIDRLDRVFSTFRADSELMRLNRGLVGSPSNDLTFVLAAADWWREASGGAFDHGRAPHLDLNAIAKGFIADAAAAVALRLGATALEVNLGGDLVHRGPEPLAVAVEDPRTPYDNAPPLARVRIRDQGLATSGTARRGEHIRDPRTSRPATGVLSATVVAADALTADALATVLTVLGPEAVPLVEAEPSASCLLVDAAGAIHTSARWPG